MTVILDMKLVVLWQVLNSPLRTVMIKRTAAKETALRGLFLFTLLIFTPPAPLLVFLDSSRVNSSFCGVIVSRLNRNRQTEEKLGIKTAVRRIKLKKRRGKKVLGRTELSSPGSKQPPPSTQHCPAVCCFIWPKGETGAEVGAAGRSLCFLCVGLDWVN